MSEKRCECGACFAEASVCSSVWWWRGEKYNGPARSCIATERNPGFCPACGCRLSVEAGEPRVGEPYADLERDAKRFTAVADAMESPRSIKHWNFESKFIDNGYAMLGEYADALLGGDDDG